MNLGRGTAGQDKEERTTTTTKTKKSARKYITGGKQVKWGRKLWLCGVGEAWHGRQYSQPFFLRFTSALFLLFYYTIHSISIDRHIGSINCPFFIMNSVGGNGYPLRSIRKWMASLWTDSEAKTEPIFWVCELLDE